MEAATAQLNTHRQSPRKVRLLADLVRGRKIADAISALRFANKRAAGPIVKLIESAVSNAKNMGMNTDALIVEKITVNGGNVLYRRLPMSRGRAFTMRKRTSHIHVSVSEGTVKGGVKASPKVAAKVKKDKPTVKMAETVTVERKPSKAPAKDVAIETKAAVIAPPAKRTKNK